MREVLCRVLGGIAVTIFVTMSAQSSYAVQCSGFLGNSPVKLPVRQAVIDREVSSETFVIRDLSNPHFVEFAGHLNSLTRELVISAYLSFPEEGFRSSISGTKTYHEMIAHFGVQNIDSIAGKWLDGDNKTEYFKNLQNGMSKEEAALATWSGRMAKGYGFSAVHSVSEDRHSMTGQVSVNVSFIRPEQ